MDSIRPANSALAPVSRFSSLSNGRTHWPCCSSQTATRPDLAADLDLVN
jgi:hypothetical protein